MAKGNSNAAEELNTGPDLELVEGDSAEVQPEEITALLDEMARQNAEQVAAEDEAAAAAAELAAEAQTDDPTNAEGGLEAAHAETTSGPVDEISEPGHDQAAHDKAPDMAGDETPSGEVPSENYPETAEPAVGPSFTMEDVMRAASESTSFTVDEIAQFESQSDEDQKEGNGEPGEAGTGEEAVGEEPEAEAKPTATVAAEPPNRSKARASESASEFNGPTKQPKLAALATGANWRAWIPWAIGPAAAAVVFFLVAGRLTGVESKVASRDKELKAALAEVADSMDSLNERFASIDKANVESALARTGHGNKHLDGGKSGADSVAKGHGKDEGAAHATKAEHDKHAKSKADDHLEEKSHSSKAETKTKSEHSEPREHKVPAHSKPKHFADDHYVASALVEGFRPIRQSAPKKKFTSRLLAMGGARPVAKRKAPTHATPKLDGGTIRVWLNGKLVPRR